MRSSSVLQMDQIYSTESVIAKRFLSSWGFSRKEGGRGEIQIMRGLPIIAGLARDEESENAGGLWKQRMKPGSHPATKLQAYSPRQLNPTKNLGELGRDSRKYFSPVYNCFLSCGSQSRVTR